MKPFSIDFKYAKSYAFRFLILVSLLPSLPGNGQPYYQFTNYTQQDGLASSTIVKVHKDSSGYIWLLSENGIMRFDGYDFKVFRHSPYDSSSISSSDVRFMIIDKDKHILFRTSNSLSKYHPETGNFTDLLKYNRFEAIKTIINSSNGIWVLMDKAIVFVDVENEKTHEFKLPDHFEMDRNIVGFSHENKILFTDKHSLYLFDTDLHEFRKINIHYSDSTLNHFRNQPIVFFRRSDKTTAFYSKDGFFFYNPVNAEFIQYATSTVPLELTTFMLGYAFISGQYLVMGTDRNKILTLDLDNGKEKITELKSNLLSTNEKVYIFSVYPDNTGKALITTSNAGVLRFDPVTCNYLPEFNQSDFNHYFSLKNVEFLLCDGDILWFTSPGGGFFKREFYKPVFSSFNPYETFRDKTSWSQNIRTISSFDKDRLLIGSLQGLFVFNQHTGIFSSLPSPIDGKPVLRNEQISKILWDRDSNLWVSAWNDQGVYCLNYKNKLMTQYYPGYKAGTGSRYSLRSMLIDSHGYLWLGTSKDKIYRIRIRDINYNHPELSVFEEISGKTLHKKNLIFTIVFALSENKKGQILIGSQDGMYVYDYLKNSYTRYINDPLITNSISDNNVRCFYTDTKQQLWIGTQGGGLNKMDESSGTFKSYSVENGLPDNSIYSIEEDKKGFLWFGTNKGLCKFNPATGECRNFTPRDGIQNFEFNTNAAYKTEDGTIVFGGINGFSVFHPDMISSTSGHYQTVITLFKTFERVLTAHNMETNLNYTENQVSFQFASLNYFRNQENQYAYKLDGVDKAWVYCGNRRFTSYANLAPGNYTFHVKASDHTGTWNEAGTEVKFIIAAAWWNSWYFRFFIVFLSFGLIYLFYLYRLKQANKLQEIRNRIARDLHDEVGSNLSSISIFSEVAQSKVGLDAKEIKPLLNKITSYTQSSMEAISDIVWVINAQNDRFENILVRMRTLAAETLENLGCTFELHADDSLFKTKIGMEDRKNLYLVFKEALNNIAKYSKCKHVVISFYQMHHLLFLKIKDDGIGFDIKQVKKGNGLHNMMKRAEALHGKLEIHSEKELGTTILLQFDNH